jgi:Holliday junction resolvase RusA-like endonuclease
MTRSLIPRLSDKAQRQIRQQLAKKREAPPNLWAAINKPREPIEFDMPIPPSVNHLFITNRGGGRTKSQDYVRYMNLVLKELCFVQNLTHVSGDVAVFVTIRRLSNLSDLDNRLKALLDSLVASRIIDDDKHIVEIGAKWSKDIDTCRVRIEPR